MQRPAKLLKPLKPRREYGLPFLFSLCRAGFSAFRHFTHNPTHTNMATRATISVLDPDTGKYLTIYSHWDGYPAHLGHMLTRHYDTHEKALELVRMGNASSIYPNLGKKHSFDLVQNKVSEHDKVCTFYGRDRGEQDAAPRTYASPYEAQKAEGQEYNYHHDGDEWFVQYDKTERAADAALMGQIADRIRQYEGLERRRETSTSKY